MSSLFGRGGKENSYDKLTEPAPLDFGGNKDEIKDRINSNKPTKPIGPNSNNLGESRNSEFYQRSDSNGKQASRLSDFSDMEITDDLSDKEIAAIRKRGYRLSNIEKQLEIKHKNDFSNIIKIILIVFSLLTGLGFLFIIAAITYTSYKAGEMTETGIIGSILEFFVSILQIGLK